MIIQVDIYTVSRWSIKYHFPWPLVKPILAFIQFFMGFTVPNNWVSFPHILIFLMLPFIKLYKLVGYVSLLKGKSDRWISHWGSKRVCVCDSVWVKLTKLTVPVHSETASNSASPSYITKAIYWGPTTPCRSVTETMYHKKILYLLSHIFRHISITCSYDCSNTQNSVATHSLQEIS